MSRAAIRYAKAVLSLASDKKAADAVNDDMRLIANTIADNKELKETLQSPVVASSIKKAIVLDVFKTSNTITVSLIDTLISNNRINLLHDIAATYNQLFDQSKGIELATVTTVVAITKDIETKALAKAKELTGKNVEIKNIIDESILGGFILRVGDIQYNASILNKLDKLKREFTLN